MPALVDDPNWRMRRIVRTENYAARYPLPNQSTEKNKR